MTLILRARYHWDVLSTPFKPSNSCYCFGILWPMNLTIPLLNMKYVSYVFTIILFYLLIISVHVCKMFLLNPKEKTKQGWQFATWVSSPWPATLYYEARSRICKFCVTLKITQQFRLLGVQLIAIFPHAPLLTSL